MIGHGSAVTPVLLGLLITIAVAVAIVLGVALPHLRQGSKILSADGEHKVRQIKERAGEAASLGGRVSRGTPPAPSRPSDRSRAGNWTGGSELGRRLADAATKARDAFDSSAGRAGRAASRYDAVTPGGGLMVEQVGERARQQLAGAVRWLRTRPATAPTDPQASATATAPLGIPLLADPGRPAPEAPRTPEVGIPRDPFARPVAAAANGSLPGPGAGPAAAPAPVPSAVPAAAPGGGQPDRVIDLRELAEPSIGEDEAARHADEDDSVQVGPRHAR
jgi:hypothetical protein